MTLTNKISFWPFTFIDGFLCAFIPFSYLQQAIYKAAHIVIYTFLFVFARLIARCLQGITYRLINKYIKVQRSLCFGFREYESPRYYEKGITLHYVPSVQYVPPRPRDPRRPCPGRLDLWRRFSSRRASLFLHIVVLRR